MTTNAFYISEWDDCYFCKSKCQIELTTVPPSVTSVEEVDGEEYWSSLTREFIELEDGTEIDSFIIDGDYKVKDGKHLDED